MWSVCKHALQGARLCVRDTNWRICFYFSTFACVCNCEIYFVVLLWLCCCCSWIFCCCSGKCIFSCLLFIMTICFSDRVINLCRARSSLQMRVGVLEWGHKWTRLQFACVERTVFLAECSKFECEQFSRFIVLICRKCVCVRYEKAEIPKI